MSAHSPLTQPEGWRARTGHTVVSLVVKRLPHLAEDERGGSPFYARSGRHVRAGRTRRIRRRSRAVYGTALRSGHLSERADSSSLTTSHSLARSRPASSHRHHSRRPTSAATTESVRGHTRTSSRHMAKSIRARRRAKATMAIFFPRRRAIASAHVRSAAVRGSFNRDDAPRRLHQQGLHIRMRTAQHAPAPLLLARAVLARDQTEIARHLRRPTEARRVIQRGDIRAGGNRTDARQRRQAA